MHYELYGIVNKVNNKVYIGQTRQGYRKRFIQHLRPYDKSLLLAKAIKKYGKENFECELIDIAYSQDEIDFLEKMWIRLLKTYKPDNGYNLLMGGKIGHFNKETIEKMSASKMGKLNSFYGKKHSEESKRKMSDWKKEHYKLANHPGSKKIKCVELNKVYDCVKIAAMELKINPQHIGQVANNKKGRKTAGGYKWIWMN